MIFVGTSLGPKTTAKTGLATEGLPSKWKTSAANMSKKCAALIHFWSHERNVETWTGWQALRSTGGSIVAASAELVLVWVLCSAAAFGTKLFSTSADAVWAECPGHH